MDFTQLRQWLAEGKTERVLDVLLRETKDIDPEQHEEATLLSARYETLSRQQRAGTLDFDDETRELARIHDGLIDLIQNLEKSRKRPFWGRPRVLAAAIAVALALVGWAVFSQRGVADKASGAPTGDIAGMEKTPPQATPPEAPEAVPGLSGNRSLAIRCKTNKGRLNVHYRAGETLRFYVQANEPCTLRAIWQMADGRLVLLENDRALTAAQSGQWVEMGPVFEAVEPFGEQTIYVFAQESAFPPLATRPAAAGLSMIADGLAQALQKTKAQRPVETEVMFKTHP